MDKIYLGDGVYAFTDENDCVVLTTGHDDPSQATNVISLEREVAKATVDYLTRFLAAK